MNKNILISILALISISSCAKLKQESNVYIALLKEMELFCEDEIGDNNVMIHLTDSELCISEDTNNKNFELLFTNVIITDSPQINGNPDAVSRRIKFRFEDSDSNKPRAELVLPLNTEIRDTVEYLNYYFQPDNSNLSFNKPSDHQVIFRLTVFEELENGANLLYHLSTEYGIQNNSIFDITDIEIKEGIDYLNYAVNFSFTCNLFHYEQNGLEGVWDRIEHGTMSLNFSIHK